MRRSHWDASPNFQEAIIGNVQKKIILPDGFEKNKKKTFELLSIAFDNTTWD